jgi:hypothetical protein
MQKFMPQSHVVIFHYQRTRSTSLDPKLAAKHDELVQLMQKFVPRIHVGIFRNGHTQSTQLDPKVMFRHVL